MKPIVRWRKIVMLILVLGLAACATGKKQFDTGMQLKQAGNYREAITYLEEAIAIEPNNSTYKDALRDLKGTLVGNLLSKAEAELLSETPVNINSVNRAKSILIEAREVAAEHPDVIRFTERISGEEQNILNSVRESYDAAKNAVESGDWFEAFTNLQQVQKMYPGYEDSEGMMQKVSTDGSEALYKKGKKSYDGEDYRSASEYLQQTLMLNPEHTPAKILQESAAERDNKEYYIKQAENEVMAQEWEHAIELYEKALTYDPDDEALKQAVANAKTSAVYYFMQEARSHLYAGWIGKAYYAYDLISSYMTGLNLPQVDESYQSLTSELSAKFVEIASDFESLGNHGSAWFWYQKTKSIDPGYQGIFYRIQAMEDKINEQIKKSIAVFDFDSPSSAPDAGAIFANNLNTYLFKTAEADIKILERENLKSILEEMKLGQVGVVSAETAKEMGRVYGIDVAVMGSVLRYNVDSTSHSDTKSVTYQVEETKENIDYLNWKALNPNATREELKNAPTPYIQVSKNVEKEYKISIYKKVAFVTVSFRVVDVKTGENILVDTIPASKTVSDETSAGVEVAGIEFDPLEIPTETELLQELTDGVVAGLGSAALSPLQGLEKKYYDNGEFYLTRRDTVQAAEYFVYSIFDLKLKGTQESLLIDQATKKLENIFQNYKMQFEQQDISLTETPNETF